MGFKPLPLGNWQAVPKALASDASDGFYHPCAIRGLPRVPTEFKLAQIARQMFVGHVMECAKDAPLQKRVIRLRKVHVDDPANVLTSVINRIVPVEAFIEAWVALVLVGHDVRGICDVWPNHSLHRAPLGIANVERANVAVPLD